MTNGEPIKRGRRRLTIKTKHVVWAKTVGVPFSLIGIVVTIGLGLISRRYPDLLPDLVGKYPGDALWALMVYLGWATVLPRASVRIIALSALVFSFAIEASQLYSAAWLDEIRSTTAGHLVLGTTFAWFDLLAYTVGVAMAVLIDVYVLIDTRAGQATS